MKGKIGTRKAGDLSHKSSVMMIVSIVAVTIFIGTAIQPALSAPLPQKDSQPAAGEKDSLPCDCEEAAAEGSGCKMCIDAVFHAVRYMRTYVKDYIQYLRNQSIYFLWTAELTLTIIYGLGLGLIDSGFKIEIDYDELETTVDFWVDLLCGPQIFLITWFMARLGAISIGITWYLLSFCVDTHRILPI